MIALVAAVIAALAALGSSDAGVTKPALVLADRSPLTIAGRGFESGERIVVKVVGTGMERRRTIVADRLGRFTTRWAGAVLPECSPYTVSATGARGSRAMLRRVQIPPACGIAPQP
ncbi:MAG: hypothetical protein H0T61_00470 [Actinobacteria bacterium]|nr:hypothetical protein [Actinomycetota bacterium]